jgi:hypothetical protein
MSLGVLGSTQPRRSGRRRAFGDLPAGWTSAIPADCFNDQSFVTCYQNQTAAANTQCAAQGNTDIGCSVPLADQYALNNCPCASIGTGTRTDDSSTTPTPAPAAQTARVTSSAKPGAAAPAQATIFGMSQQTAIIAGLVVVGLYMFTGKKP